MQEQLFTFLDVCVAVSGRRRVELNPRLSPLGACVELDNGGLLEASETSSCRLSVSASAARGWRTDCTQPVTGETGCADRADVVARASTNAGPAHHIRCNEVRSTRLRGRVAAISRFVGLVSRSWLWLIRGGLYRPRLAVLPSSSSSSAGAHLSSITVSVHSRLNGLGLTSHVQRSLTSATCVACACECWRAAHCARHARTPMLAT